MQRTGLRSNKNGKQKIDNEHDVSLLLNSKLEPTTDDYESSEANESGEEDKQVELKPSKQNLKKDYGNIALLLLLYFLQGIPLGLTGSLPFILTTRKVSYADQGTFSFAFWPFSLKLLWAPIVDSIFFKRFGRRKSWLIPIQYLIGIFMILFSDFTMELLEGKSTVTEIHNHIYVLTAIFFMLTFLAATQDIVVDGWALTMLSKENVSWGSTCNTVGQTAGWFVGNVLFLTVESANFSNQYIRSYLGLADQTYGICTVDKFMNIFGVIFIVTTTFVMFFKREKSEEENDNTPNGKKKPKSFEDTLTVTGTYKLMWRILWLVPIKKLVIILMTVKIGFAVESMSYLKLIENGVPKEKLGLLAVPLTPLQLVLPFLLSRYTNGANPFNLYIKSIPYRLVMSVVVALWVYVTPMFKDSTNEYPLYYYLLCLLINSIQTVFTYSMFVSQMAFFAKISDPQIGGTFMTFLNTVTNMGSNWPATSALYIANYIDVKSCHYDQSRGRINGTIGMAIDNNNCSSDAESKECEKMGGTCVTNVDAFYTLTMLCTVIGIFWYLRCKSVMVEIQKVPKSAYKVVKRAV